MIEKIDILTGSRAAPYFLAQDDRLNRKPTATNMAVFIVLIKIR